MKVKSATPFEAKIFMEEYRAGFTLPLIRYNEIGDTVDYI